MIFLPHLEVDVFQQFADKFQIRTVKLKTLTAPVAIMAEVTMNVVEPINIIPVLCRRVENCRAKHGIVTQMKFAKKFFTDAVFTVFIVIIGQFLKYFYSNVTDFLRVCAGKTRFGKVVTGK